MDNCLMVTCELDIVFYSENKVLLSQSVFLLPCLCYKVHSATLNAAVGGVRINLKTCNGSKIHQVT